MQTPSFAIRSAVPDDAAAIGRVHAASWQTTYAGIVSPAYLATVTAEKREQAARNVLANPEVVYLVAEVEGKIVGLAVGGPDRTDDAPGSYELFAIYLLQERQGCGIGKALLTEIASRLYALDAKRMTVSVLARNPALHFYEACGAVRLRDETLEIGGEMYESIVLVWEDVRTLCREGQA